MKGVMRLYLTDEKIIELFFERNDRAVNEIQMKYGKLCFTVAMNILGDREDAEECVNDTYLGAWNSIPPNRPNALSAYLIKITRNLSLKKLRFERTEKRGGGEGNFSFDELSECIPDGSDVSKSIEASELSKHISDFLRKIPETDRRIFVLRYFYCDSIEEISKRFGFGESKVKMKLSRTRKKLSAYLTERGLVK